MAPREELLQQGRWLFRWRGWVVKRTTAWLEVAGRGAARPAVEDPAQPAGATAR